MKLHICLGKIVSCFFQNFIENCSTLKNESAHQGQGGVAENIASDGNASTKTGGEMVFVIHAYGARKGEKSKQYKRARSSNLIIL